MTVNLELPKLNLITDRTQTKGRPLIDVVKAALDGGVRLIQLREKDLSSRELFRLAGELREITNHYSAKLLINDRVDIAMAVNADGVHLGRQSMSIKDVRQAFTSVPGTVPILRQDKPLPVNRDSPLFLIGVSTHSIKEAMEAESGGADLITFGPVYHTPSKAKYGEPVGLERLKEAADAVRIPVFAIGGIKVEKIDEVMRAGAYGVSMISAIMAEDDVKKAAEEILKHLAGNG